MTDTEVKALALMNEATDSNSDDIEDFSRGGVLRALLHAIERLEATEARHAAELRELKERFSEAAVRAVKHLDLTYYNKGSPSQIEREAVVAGLASFIIPAPDPLVEVFDECFHQAVEEGQTWSQAMARKTRAAIEARGGRIVWGDGE